MPSAALVLLPLNHKFLFITHEFFLIFCYFFVCGAHESISEKETQTERSRERERERFGYRRTALWLCLLGEIAISDVFLSPNNAEWVRAVCVCELLIYKFCMCKNIPHVRIVGNGGSAEVAEAGALLLIKPTPKTRRFLCVSLDKWNFYL